ncbi:MAG TPA: hypothetical protein VMA74_15410 [Dyella sp.]|uniref:hypothetical protein n=1 Tax=Dyella sp. TaxID=1869338 RepID=UPI002D120692|nr:hypothetical protein [Dyella sp.]HUB91111.1 hypothetical protein [Dyella sp.]
MPATDRPLGEVDSQLLAACHSLGALAEHIAASGLQEQPLINLERITDAFRRLLVERRAALVGVEIA